MIESLMPVIAAFIYFFKSKNKLKMLTVIKTYFLKN